MPAGEPRVFPLRLQRRDDMAPDVARFELVADEPGTELPPFEAGAYIDVVIAPE